MSLSNLLDQRPQPMEGPLSGLSSGLSSGQATPSSSSQPPAATAAVAAAAAATGGSSGGGAEDGGGEAGARGRRVRSAPQWQHKQAVIEMLNELIDELDGIEAQIAHQAVEHIHANEVHGD